MKRKRIPAPEAAEAVELKAPAELSLVTAEMWKPLLLDSLNQSRAAVVDLSEAMEMDLASVQLLLSARRSFSGRGVPFTFRDPAGIFELSAKQAGIRLAEGGADEQDDSHRG